MPLENITVDLALAKRPFVDSVIIGVFLALVSLITVLGNLLVIVTVTCQRRLQCVRNYWILALAVSDLLLGVLVLPFSTVNTALRWWPLGAVFCNVYMSFDVMLCTVSILTLFAISVDRHLAVSRPLRYTQLVTKRRMSVALSAIWVFSFAMAFVPIHLGWNTADGRVQNVATPRECGLAGNKVYVLLVAIGTYFSPLIIMCLIYLRLFLVTKRQVRHIRRLMKTSPGASHKNGQVNVSETKATIALSTIILAFTICWVPYFILFVIRPFLNQPVNRHIDDFVLWLGYVNSMCNPVLYAFCSTEFRGAFKRTLTGRHLRFFSGQSSEGTMV